MIEAYKGREPDRNEPKTVCFGTDPTNPEHLGVGRLYDHPGQVFEPEADRSRSGGLRSLDSRYADTSFGFGRDRPESEGLLLIKTKGQTYLVQSGVLIHVEETVRTGELVAEVVEDSNPRIIIGGGSWGYKPAGAPPGLVGWKDIGGVIELAVDGGESDNSRTLKEHYAMGTLYEGFEDVAMELVSASVNPAVDIEVMLSMP